MPEVAPPVSAIPEPAGIPVQPKRRILAQVSVCRACCCGAVERGKPEVPVEWIKGEWKRRGLRKSVQLTISGCLGPCELSNVVAVSFATGSIWLGNLHGFECYEQLVEWASRCQAAGERLPLPEQLSEFRFEPFLFTDP